MGKAAETLEPRIYVACLAAYNNGILHGAWIDVEDDAVREAIEEMLKASPIPLAEEYAITTTRTLARSMWPNMPVSTGSSKSRLSCESVASSARR